MPASSVTFHLVATTFLICFGSSFLIGYYIGIFNNPTSHIKEFVEVYAGVKLRGNQTDVFPSKDLLYSLANTVVVIGATIGAFSCGWVADFFGRRNGILINHILAIIGVLLVGPVVYAQQPVLLYLGRFFSGLNNGVSIGLASLYLTEIAPRSLRGTIGACHQLAITLGIFISYLTTMDWSMNTATLWPVAYVLSLIPCVTSLLLLPFLPESPRYLFLKRKDEVGARAAFAKLNKTEDIETFIGELREEVEVASQQPAFKFSQLFLKRDLRMPVLLACLIQMMQQLSGINAVMFYSSTMFNTAGVPSEYNQICVLIIGLVNVFATIVSLPLLERLGRRSLLLWPSLVLALSLLLLTVVVSVSNATDDIYAKQYLGGTSVFFIFVFTISFAMGLGPVPGLIVSEIFRQGPRAAAYSLSQGIQSLSNLLVTCTFPMINSAIGGYSFLPFFVVVVCCWIVFFLFMPETMNKTFDEVATDLAFGNIVVGKRRTATLADRPLELMKGAGADAGAANTGGDDAIQVHQRLLLPEEERV